MRRPSAPKKSRSVKPTSGVKAPSAPKSALAAKAAKSEFTGKPSTKISKPSVTRGEGVKGRPSTKIAKPYVTGGGRKKPAPSPKVVRTASLASGGRKAARKPRSVKPSVKSRRYTKTKMGSISSISQLQSGVSAAKSKISASRRSRSSGRPVSRYGRSSSGGSSSGTAFGAQREVLAGKSRKSSLSERIKAARKRFGSPTPNLGSGSRVPSERRGPSRRPAPSGGRVGFQF